MWMSGLLTLIGWSGKRDLVVSFRLVDKVR